MHLWSSVMPHNVLTLGITSSESAWQARNWYLYSVKSGGPLPGLDVEKTLTGASSRYLNRERTAEGGVTVE